VARYCDVYANVLERQRQHSKGQTHGR
jgi:hypothetical protein